MSDTSDNAANAPTPWTKEQLARLKMQIIKGETPMMTPNSGRFEKGKSGNPRGRPRKDRRPPPALAPGSLHAMTLEESRQLLSVRGSDEKIPAKRAVLKAQLASAITGNAHAQRHLLERFDRAETVQAAELARQQSFWREYIATQRTRIAEAKTKGEPEPLILPHPDDIVIEPGEPVRFVGPCNEPEHKRMLATIRFRDQLVLQAELDERYWPFPRTKDPLDGPSAAGVLAELMNNALPPRLRWTDDDRLWITLRMQRLTNRELLKKTYQGWQSIRIGIARRGRLTKPMRWAKEFILRGHSAFAAQSEIAADSSQEHGGKILDEVNALAAMGSIWMAQSLANAPKR